MGKPEQLAWDALRPVMAGCGLDPRRVENVVGPGHPDVNYAGGDIELKAIPEMPASVATVMRPTEFSGEQAGWLAQRWIVGGNAWLAVRVWRYWFLFDGWTSLKVREGLTYQQWIDEACVVVPPGRWGDDAGFDGAHCYSRQLADWLRFDLDRMMPGHRARAMRLRARVRLDRIVEETGMDRDRVVRAECGPPNADTETLLAYWED